ncbi:Metal resistance protein YCF1 [Pseudozyma hubeiensis]|nr:Metal resistance protein YCF1 [Pseudozyma hubeiensis]
MAIFKGGPALPKRSETTMSAPPATNTSPPTTPARRTQRTTAVLSNRPDDINTDDADMQDMDSGDDYATSTFRGSSTDDMSDTGITTPTSNIRSTSRNNNVKRELDDADVADGSPAKTRETAQTEDAARDVKPMKAEPSTPKKARANAAAGSSKDGPKTPTKRQVSSAPATPGQAGESLSNWSSDHWDDLNFAILKVALDHSAELYEASPSLNPWRFKGRLLVKVRQLMKDATGGDVAGKRWDVECKFGRAKSSPKK